MRAGDGAEAPSEARNRKYRAPVSSDRTASHQGDSRRGGVPRVPDADSRSRESTRCRGSAARDRATCGWWSSCAVGAEEAEHLALRDLERQVLETTTGP